MKVEKSKDAKGTSFIRIFRMVNAVKKGEGEIVFPSWKNEADPFFKMKKSSGGYWVVIDPMDSEDFTVGDLSRYDKRVESLTLFVIEGKVRNQSKFIKKYIKIRFIILDEDEVKVAEQDAICGCVVDREELKKQPPEFFKGDMMIKPETEREMITPPGWETPFMVIFKNLSSRAKDFKYEILEAPNLYPLDEPVAYWEKEKVKEVIDEVQNIASTPNK
jgi:hypothetical protein